MLAEMHVHVAMYMNNTILLNSHVIIMFTRVTFCYNYLMVSALQI